MRTPVALFAVPGFAISLGASVLHPQTPAAPLIVHAENTLAISRTDETIGIPWATIRSQLPTAQPGQVRVIDAATRREIVSQVVDNDGDGQLDELIFQANFFPSEGRTFSIEEGKTTAVDAKARVFVMHADPRDDVAWESDRIAYRIYGQGLWKVDSLLSSGVDVWTKRVRDPIVQKWYAKPPNEYHHDTGEGADFFDVGESLGAGGTGVWSGGKIYRAANFKSWRIIANGPIRAIFELQYEPWEANGLRVSETKRISIDAGQNLNRAISIFRSANGADVPYVIGLVKRKGVVGSTSKAQSWAWLTLWGPLSPKNGGHGDLGTAVLLPRDRVADWKEDDTHYFAVSLAKSGVPVTHYIGAGWTDSGDFGGVRDWWEYLTDAALRFATPVKVSLSRNGAALVGR
jgi:pectinesterase